MHILRLQAYSKLIILRSYKRYIRSRPPSARWHLEIITHNPAAGRFKFHEEIKSRETKNGVWLTSFAEHKQVLEVAKGHDIEPILVLGLCFGLRKGEILGLDWPDVDFDNRQITIRQTYTQSAGAPELLPPKTAKSLRTIPMPDYAYERLHVLQCKGGLLSTGPVVRERGRRLEPQAAQRRMTKFVRNHNVPKITIMSLRHSFATSAIRSGINAASVSKWLGHTDVTTTLNRYVRPMLANLHDDVAIINAGYTSAAQ